MSEMNRDAKKLDRLLKKTLGLLDQAYELAPRAGTQPPGATLKTLGRAYSDIVQARETLHEAAPTPAATAKLQARASPAAAVGTEGQAAAALPPRTGILRLRRGRTSVWLRTTGDITRMALRLLVPWTLPNIKVGFDETLPSLEIQRAQTRITQRSDACQRLFLGPLLAAATVVAGSFNIVWSWKRNFSDLGFWTGAALCAWVAGNLVNAVWCRFRLLLELLRLRHQIGRAKKLVVRLAA